MRVEKEKRRIIVVLNDGSLLKGFVYINPGERMSDFINDPRESFIVLSDVELYSIENTQSFDLPSKSASKKNIIILNKSVIKLIEEV